MIVLNAVMLVISYLIANRIITIVYPDIKGFEKHLIAFISIITPGMLANCHLAWPEIMLGLLCWLTIWLLVEYLYSQKTIWLVFFSIVLPLAYYVHQRALGLLLSGLITLLFVAVIKKIRIWKLIIPIILLISIFVIFAVTKNHLKSFLYIQATNDNSSINDYGAVVPYTFKLITSCESFLELFISFCGKCYNLLIASALLWGVGIICLVRLFLKNVKTVILRQNDTNQSNKVAIAFYIIVLQVSCLGISTIINSYPHRMDHLVYGRYTEWAMGCVVLIALCHILTCDSRKLYAALLILLVFLTPVLSFYYSTHKLDSFSWVCSFALYFFANAFGEDKFVIYASKVTIALTLIIASIKKNRVSNLRLLLLV